MCLILFTFSQPFTHCTFKSQMLKTSQNVRYISQGLTVRYKTWIIPAAEWGHFHLRSQASFLKQWNKTLWAPSPASRRAFVIKARHKCFIAAAGRRSYHGYRVTRGVSGCPLNLFLVRRCCEMKTHVSELSEPCFSDFKGRAGSAGAQRPLSDAGARRSHCPVDILHLPLRP